MPTLTRQYYYPRNRRICLIDFGMVGKLSKRDKLSFAGVFISMAQQDARAMASYFRRLATEDEIADIRAFEADLQEIIDDFAVLDVRKAIWQNHCRMAVLRQPPQSARCCFYHFPRFGYFRRYWQSGTSRYEHDGRNKTLRAKNGHGTLLAHKMRVATRLVLSTTYLRLSTLLSERTERHRAKVAAGQATHPNRYRRL